jgi:hypothetical protein
MSILFLRAATLAAALLPYLATATPLSFDAALRLAAQRSETARAARAGVLSATERRTGCGPASRSHAAHRRRQPARDRAGPLSHHQRFDDDEAHRHQPGMAVRRQARRTASRRRCLGRPRGGAGRAPPWPMRACRPRWRTSTPSMPASPEARDAHGAPCPRGAGGIACAPVLGRGQQPGRAGAGGRKRRLGRRDGGHPAAAEHRPGRVPALGRPAARRADAARGHRAARRRKPTSPRIPRSRQCSAMSMWRGRRRPSPRPTASPTGPGRWPTASAPAIPTWCRWA